MTLKKRHCQCWLCFHADNDRFITDNGVAMLWCDLNKTWEHATSTCKKSLMYYQGIEQDVKRMPKVR